MLKKLVFVLLADLVIMGTAIRVRAEDLNLMRVTCYYQNSGVTADGSIPKGNYTAAGCRDYMGCVALIYENDNGVPGDFIGLYEIRDTGSHERIVSGKSIDIYQETYDLCKQYVKAHGDYLWVQIIRGEG